MKRLLILPLALLMLPLFVVDADSQRRFDLERERERLWDWLADRHAELGDEARKVELYADARSQYNRARLLVKDHRNAMRGLGFRQRRGDWVEEDPMPERSNRPPADIADDMRAFAEQREAVYQRCAARVQGVMDRASRADDALSVRLLASDLLFYDPDNAPARALRNQVRHGHDWIPDFAKEWHTAGQSRVERATYGEEVADRDPDEEKVNMNLAKRRSQYIGARASMGEPRAQELHKVCEATMWRAMDVLGRDADPFGRGLRFTASHLRRNEYESVLREVLELEPDRLTFALRLSGHGTRTPWGFMSRVEGSNGANDALCNTIAIRVMETTREGTGNSQPWISVGFSYLITSQTLGSTSTVRYTLQPGGKTAAGRDVEPELTRRSGTPEALREIAYNMVAWGPDVPLGALVHTETNDMTVQHAAKAFSLMEFFFHQYPEQARAWLRTPVAERDRRLPELVDAFGKPIDELEAEWTQWVLERY